MRYAETGYNLEIDLATGNIERVETDPGLLENHLGGLGTSLKLIWDRVPPETQAFDPENLLIFSAGLLCGTPAYSCNPHHRDHRITPEHLSGLSHDGRELGRGTEVRGLGQGGLP